MDGLAHSLTIGVGGRLDHYASSALRMHTKWARGRHGDSVGDDTYRDALDVATSLHTALIVDRRGAHIPERTQVNTDVDAPATETTPTRRPKGP